MTNASMSADALSFEQRIWNRASTAGTWKSVREGCAAIARDADELIAALATNPAPVQQAESPATAPEPAALLKELVMGTGDRLDRTADYREGWNGALLAAQQSFAALATPSPTGATVPGVLTDEQPVGHLHSNGDFCVERMPDYSSMWPVPLYASPLSAHREQA